MDLAKAHVFAVTRMLEGKMKQDCEIFNIGTGRPLSVMELIKAFEKVNGVKVNYRKLQTAPDGKFYEVLAQSKNIMAKEK